jgi:hypothetical protein
LPQNVFINIYNVGIEDLTTVVLKSSVFWDITLCSPSSNISEEYIASVFKVEEQGKQKKTVLAGSKQIQWLAFNDWMALYPRTEEFFKLL